MGQYLGCATAGQTLSPICALFPRYVTLLKYLRYALHTLDNYRGMPFYRFLILRLTRTIDDSCQALTGPGIPSARAGCFFVASNYFVGPLLRARYLSSSCGLREQPAFVVPGRLLARHLFFSCWLREQPAFVLLGFLPGPVSLFFVLAARAASFSLCQAPH